MYGPSGASRNQNWSVSRIALGAARSVEWPELSRPPAVTAAVIPRNRRRLNGFLVFILLQAYFLGFDLSPGFSMIQTSVQCDGWLANSLVTLTLIKSPILRVAGDAGVRSFHTRVSDASRKML